MSVKKLFDKNRKNGSVGKYLKKSSVKSLDSKIESSGHLSESVRRQNDYLPPIDYSRPENFAKYGSAQKYYEAAFDHIVDNYPYDGSGLEKTKFYNELSPLEKYVLQHVYPKETGYIKIGASYGTPGDVADNPSGYYSSSIDFVQAKGGPHAGNVYATGSNTTSNLTFAGVSGSTIEFFLKKDNLIPNDNSQSKKQVIFDLSNGSTSGSSNYGRLRIELTSSDQDRFLVTLVSGTTGFMTQSVPTTGGLAIASGSWHHYSFVFNTSGPTPNIDFYMDGICHQTNITASSYGGPSAAGNIPSEGGVKSGSLNEVTGTLVANIGALRAPVSGTNVGGAVLPTEGWGKISASIDEFRFWKKARTGKEIGRNWFTNIDGGANVNDADASLGLYYKFNEGITGVARFDKTVLDYSGRVANGTYVGYDSSNSRQTGSAINEMSKKDIFEDRSPVIRRDNTNFKNTRTELANTGSEYDHGNTSYLMNTMPAWIIDEDAKSGNELKNLSQIIGSYFDTLHIQISELNKTKDLRYLSGTLTGSSNEFPYNNRLLENQGLNTTEMFANADILERFFKRSDSKNFEQELQQIKSIIYKNIHNNLGYIYKSKGNEKAIRNLIRCYGIDQNIVSLNTYANNYAYELEDNYRTISSNKKYVDFSGLRTSATSSDATVYQCSSSINPASHGFITGSDGVLNSLGMTAECEFIFPNRQNSHNLEYNAPSMVSCSLFGWHTPTSASSPYETDTTWAKKAAAADGVGESWQDQGFQIYAVKTAAENAEITSPEEDIKDVRFIVKDRFDNTLITSSVFQNVYDNQKWNLALTLAPAQHPLSGGIAGMEGPSTAVYKLSLYGVNYDSGIKRSSFYEVQNLAYNTGSQALEYDKRFYLGAHRTNFTGAVLTPSDMRASSLRVWSTILPTGTIDLHAKDVDSFGTLHPLRQAYGFASSSEGSYPEMFIPEIETLALHWDFANVTGSDKDGKFDVSDFSSGSLQGIVAAEAAITTTGGPLNDETFALTDAAELTVGFIFKTSVTTVDGTKDGDNVIIGVNGAVGSAAATGERIRDAINASDLAMTAVEEVGPLRITLTQQGAGASGNTTIDMSGVTTVTATSFTGGRDSYESSYQGKLLSNVNLRQHTGRGEFFATSSLPVMKEYVQTYQKQLPEYVASSDMVEVVAEDVNVFQTSMKPSDFYYSIEKSMYQGISRKMLDFFASIDDFNNLIGEPVNTYRSNYKHMEKMREIFFRRVGSTPDFDKYAKYYKWIDASIGELVIQLFPATARHAPELRTMIESHALERSKYKYSYLGNQKEMLSLVDDGIEGTAGEGLGYSQNSSSAETNRQDRRQGKDKNTALISFNITNQRAPQYRYLSPPLGNLEKDNVGYWKYTADITDVASPLSSSNNINPAKTSIRNAATSDALRSKVVNISGFYGQQKTDNRGLIQRSGKTGNKNNIFDVKVDEFEELPSNEDFRKVVPNQKRKVPFRSHTYVGADKAGELIAPFSAYDLSGSEVVAGYITRLQTASSSLNVDITNFHQDIPGNYHEGVPLQGPFTKQHVGGLLGRNVPALRENILAQNINRTEVFSTVIADQAAATCTLSVAAGLAASTYALSDINGKTLTLTIGGVSYSATVNSSVAIGSSTKTVIGVNGASDNDDLGDAIVNSINAAISSDSLPVTVSNSADKSQVVVSSTITGELINSIDFGGTYPASDYLSSTGFSGGINFNIRLAKLVTGSVPKGHYTRNNMAKSPVNIANIRSATGSLTAAGSSSRGLQTLGNFDKNYEVVHGVGRENANIDFLFNNDFYTASNPTAFLTTAARRLAGLSGSADYTAPRQKTTRRTGKSIISSRFASPGSKEDSKQQYRDIATDQFSPNNALPFRNLFTRRTFNSQSMTFTGWGGFKNSDVVGVLPNISSSHHYSQTQNQGPTALTQINQGSGSHAAIHKTQRNQTSRYQILANYPNFNGLSDQNPNELRTYNTASKHDNDYVQRPIPAADRIKWFTSLTGSNFTRNINNPGGGAKDQEIEWTLSGSRLPESVTIIHTEQAATSSLSAATTLGGWIVGAVISGKGNLSEATKPSLWPTAKRGGNTPLSVYNWTGGWQRRLPPAPWSQTRVGQSNLGSFHRKNNLYELPPVRKPVLSLMTRDSEKYTEEYSTTTRNDTDRGYLQLASANAWAQGHIHTRDIEFRHYKKFKEPPVTSRYKPMVHTIETKTGSPDNINGESMTLDLKYSYGNVIQGFANKDLSREILGSRKHLLGKIKRPYEVILDYKDDNVDSSVSGLDNIKMMTYEETIFPKEVYTYLSGTRKRLAFTNNDWWRNDRPTGSTAPHQTTISDISHLIAEANEDYPGIIILTMEALKKDFSSTYNRMSGGFITSQGHQVLDTAQIAQSKDDGGSDFPNRGSGSIWPLDSFLFSEFVVGDRSAGNSFGIQTGARFTGACENTAHKLGGAVMSTLPAGELMMPHYGRAFINAPSLLTKSDSGSPGSDQWTTSSITSVQYVYTVPILFSASNAGSVGGKDVFVTASSPGGAMHALPAWTAGKTRRFVDGTQKGNLAEPRFPYYEDYDTWNKDARAIAKDFSIIPEFRISEQLEDYQAGAGAVMGLVSRSLELTGASHTVYDSTDTTFLERYSTTDVMEFLAPFMEPNSADAKMNKAPRHLSLRSNAVLKILPYNGFYPVIRTVQLATLFSQSYGPWAIWRGESASHPQRWTTLLRPFFAPGILYNSIKSGMAVSYPVRRDGSGQDHAYLTGSTGAGATDMKFMQPLAGCLSQSLTNDKFGQLPGNRRRRAEGSFGNFDFSNADVSKVFWADRIPFEGILKPMDHIGADKQGILTSDFNYYLRHFVTGTIAPTGSTTDLLYRLGMSNFLGAVPEFFLKQKKDGGFMTKIVAELPPKGDPTSPKGQSPVSDTEPRTVFVDNKKAYMMEIALRKSDRFNMYNNPAAFGVPTSTGSAPWDNQAQATTSSYGTVPEGRNWPLHRGEFAPFAPPYYYGPSVCRLTYFPETSREVTLDDILNGSEIYAEYINENGHYYDLSSGSFFSPDGFEYSATGAADFAYYGWNRAWQNRMDIDETIVIDNSYPSEFGGEFKPANKNRWVIMPKWETPCLDFPRGDQRDGGNAMNTYGYAQMYNFSSSVAVGKFDMQTYGMWHQYGVMPGNNEGIFLYISDVNDKTTEFRLTNDDPLREGSSSGTYKVFKCLKIPRFVKKSGRDIESLAKLVGFKEEDIMPAGQFLPERAKRMGELGEDGEKIISEAIVAIPYYYDTENQRMSAMTLRADPDRLGEKIKEFRRVFTQYSLPPELRKSLVGLLPPDYPKVPNFINPFGGDDLDKVLSGVSFAKTPVVYLMEHKIALSRQDLSDIWQGIMPELATKATFSVSSIDHYMPGKSNSKEKRPMFDEILEKQMELGIHTDGFPRVDLLDTTSFGDKNGFIPEIRWLVFKVKKRAQTSYTGMLLSEVNGGDDQQAFSSIFGYLADDLPEAQRQELLKRKDEYTKGIYHNDLLGQGRNTYNWPYDYFSLIEMAKLTTKVGFRPDLKEVEPADDVKEIKKLEGNKKIEKTLRLDPNLLARRSVAGNFMSSGPLTPNAAQIAQQISGLAEAGNLSVVPQNLAPPPIQAPLMSSPVQVNVVQQEQPIRLAAGALRNVPAIANLSNPVLGNLGNTGGTNTGGGGFGGGNFGGGMGGGMGGGY